MRRIMSAFASALLLVLALSLVLTPAAGAAGPQSAPAAQGRPSIMLGQPAYDSGWHTIGLRPDPVSLEFTHNLGHDPSAYLIDLQSSQPRGMGVYDNVDQSFGTNAAWYDLTSTSIKVYADNVLPIRVRVRIYRLTPAYDSGWRSLGTRPDPISAHLNHELGGDPDRYLVDLQCREEPVLGIYGGVDHNFRTNAMWYDLTAGHIKVYASSVFPTDVRVRIYRLAPTFVSDWEELGAHPDPIAVPFEHGLGGNSDEYLVRLACRDDSSLGTYAGVDQGFRTNATWYGLNDSEIEAYAAAPLPDQLQIRIWRHHVIYVPLIDKG